MERLIALIGAAALLLLAWFVPWLRFVLTIALAKGIAVLGIMLLVRAGQVSFGHALFVAFAAYIVAFTQAGTAEALVLVPLAAVGAGLLGLLVGLFVVRYRDIFFGMLNLALSMVFYSLLEKFYSITHGTDGIRVAGSTIAGQVAGTPGYEFGMFLFALLLALGFAWATRTYIASPPGQALSALKTRETRLEFLGIPARAVLLAAYVLSAVMAGVAGALIALTTRHVTPLLGYWTASGELVFIAILGGAGSVIGAFLGAVTFELVRVYAGAILVDAWQAVLGGVLLLVILFAPGGLWGMLVRFRKGARA